MFVSVLHLHGEDGQDHHTGYTLVKVSLPVKWTSYLEEIMVNIFPEIERE